MTKYRVISLHLYLSDRALDYLSFYPGNFLHIIKESLNIHVDMVYQGKSDEFKYFKKIAKRFSKNAEREKNRARIKTDPEYEHYIRRPLDLEKPYRNNEANVHYRRVFNNYQQILITRMDRNLRKNLLRNFKKIGFSFHTTGSGILLDYWKINKIFQDDKKILKIIDGLASAEIYYGETGEIITKAYNGKRLEQKIIENTFSIDFESDYKAGRYKHVEYKLIQTHNKSEIKYEKNERSIIGRRENSIREDHQSACIPNMFAN